MTIKVLMQPHLSEIGNVESGIHTVLRKYFQHLPQFDIELVEPDATSFDLRASHAGITGGDCEICHCHGLYWSSDFVCDEWQWHVNSRVIEAVRNAKEITVPSEWVNEVFKRDIRKSVHVIPHGIDWREWQHKEDNQGYVLWNKNRNSVDVCDNSILDILTSRFSDVPFVSTFPTSRLGNFPFSQWPKNFKIIESGGKTPHLEMRRYIQQASVYLSTAHETFGISILEAMASGKPVLGWEGGGNSILVKHGVTGFLAQPGDVDSLCEGLEYCQKHQIILGKNGQEVSKEYTWAKACLMIADVYKLALQTDDRPMKIDASLYELVDDKIDKGV